MSTNPVSVKHDPFPDPVSHSLVQRGAAGTPSASDPAAKGRGRGRGWAGDFWALMGCNAIVFGASICIMVVELTASRLIAVHLGASLYTWTSVIGVVLAGISVGNYLGGWLADRFVSSQKLLSVLFVIASVLCFSVLWLNQQASHLSRPEDMHWPTWVLAIVTGTFLLPAMALGTISPVVATMALRRSTKAGITVGSVYAWGALGSIVGTFFTGFYLLDVIGTQMIIVLTSAALAVMGLVIGVGQWAFRSAVMFGWLQFVAVVGMCAAVDGEGLSVAGRHVGRLIAGNPDKPSLKEADRSNRRRKIQRWASNSSQIGSSMHELGLALKLRDDRPGVYRDESNYYTITITDEVVDGDSIKELKLDHLIHSYWNPDNPAKLYYDYERVYAGITERAASRWSRDVSTLFIGGGGFVFPRWIEQRFPGQPQIDVAEIDPAVKLAAQTELGLPEDGKTAVRTHIGDARKFIDDRRRANRRLAGTGDPGTTPVRYDFVYGDAFNDFSVPWHLTTREFTEKVKELLNPATGIFLVNIIDIYPRATSSGLNELPPLLTPVLLPPKTWTSAPDRLQNVEVYDDGDGYKLGFRGVMSDQTYEHLATLSEKMEYHAALGELLRKSRAERAGKFLGRYVATVREIFPHVYVYSSNERAPGDQRDTFVVTCSMNKLDLSNLKQAGGHWAGEPFAWTETEHGARQDHGKMDSVLELARGLILTDDFAPVDNLLAPVFVRR